MVTVGLIIAMFYITAEIDDTSVVALMIAVFNTVLPILTKVRDGWFVGSYFRLF